MRTKVLLCAAALAASLATSMAQNVYSLNVVGYYNVTVPQNGLALIANQLNTTNNEIQYVIPNAADFTILFKFTGGGFTSTTFTGSDQFGNGWDQPNITMNPGEAAFLYDQGNTPGGQTLTFVGTVLQGSLSNNLPLNHIAFTSYMVPVATTLDGVNGDPTVTSSMQVPGEDFDTVYTYNGGYSTTTYEGTDQFGNGWDYDGTGAGPTIPVGHGFAYLKSPSSVEHAWVASFTVQ